MYYHSQGSVWPAALQAVHIASSIPLPSCCCSVLHCLQVFCVLLFGYLLEPLLTRVYMVNIIAAGEKVLATLRMELFRTLLMQKIEFFDKHSATALQSLISVELDTIRTFIFKWVAGLGICGDGRTCAQQQLKNQKAYGVNKSLVVSSEEHTRSNGYPGRQHRSWLPQQTATTAAIGAAVQADSSECSLCWQDGTAVLS